MRRENLEELSFCNEKNRRYANELFGSTGYCVIRNFLSGEEVARIRSKWENSDRLKTVGKKDGYHHFLACYMYKNSPNKPDAELYQIVRNAYRIRNEIALQPNGDLFMLDYCQRRGIRAEDMDALIEAQLDHSWFRIAKYRKGEGQVPHYDNPAEIQGILPLTKKGIDYTTGGLYLHEDDGSETDVDSLVSPGDLILLNAYRKKHSVRPVECNDNQAGRIHLFIPVIPEYVFSSPAYFFKNARFRLHFTRPMGRVERYTSYLKHWMSLARGRATAVDQHL